jgi:hypothetical protein
VFKNTGCGRPGVGPPGSRARGPPVSKAGISPLAADQLVAGGSRRPAAQTEVPGGIISPAAERQCGAGGERCGRTGMASQAVGASRLEPENLVDHPPTKWKAHVPPNVPPIMP